VIDSMRQVAPRRLGAGRSGPARSSPHLFERRTPDVASRRSTVRMDHPVIITFLILAIIAFMYFAAEVLQPLALAILLCFVLAPISRFLERHGVPRFAAVLLTVVTVLGTLGVVGYIVGQQLTALGNDLPKYERNITDKARRIVEPTQESAIEKVTKVASNVAEKLEPNSPVNSDIVDVRIVSHRSFQERLRMTIGPYLEPIAVGSLVLILVLFILLNREDLSDRIVQLFGLGRISLTTRTMEEAGQRISRYLAIFSTYNATFGLIVTIGLWLIGIPYAVLWGFLTAVLRFIPYVGPTTAFALPLLFAIARFDTWREPALVAALFMGLEAISSGFLEPVVYGRTTGITAVGLLVSATFWTWLWGPLGLLMSTPLTSCLAVLGKYVPSLRFFATLLGEEAVLDPDVRFYQRLLLLDQDGAIEIVEEALKQTPRAEVFDHILIPALSRAERDASREEIDETQQAFVWRVIDEILDEMTATPSPQTIQARDGQAEEVAARTTAPLPDGAPRTAPVAPASGKILGVATNDVSDGLVLRMLGQLLLETPGLMLEIITDASSPLKVADQVAQNFPDLILLSHLPPVGLTPARYLVRRLRARFADLPIWVGRWGETGAAEGAADRLMDAGATRVVHGVADARQRILEALRPKAEAQELSLASSSS
jgi:predicted PurR-regulated permease PerM